MMPAVEFAACRVGRLQYTPRHSVIMVIKYTAEMYTVILSFLSMV